MTRARKPWDPRLSRLRHAIVALAALALSPWCGACGAAQWGRDPYPLHGEPETVTFVAVGPRVRLATAPDVDAWTAHDLAARDDGPRRWLRVRGERGGWLAVSPHDPAAAGDHCAEAFAGAQGLDLWLWVRKAEAQDVLTAPHVIDHANGTGLWLRPGTPVGPPVADAGGGRHWRGVRTDQFLTAVAVNAAALGDRYQPSHLPAAATSAEGLWSNTGARLWLGDGELLLRDKQMTVELWPVAGASPLPAGALYETRDRCGVYRLRAGVEAVQAGGGMLGMLGSAASGRTALRAGSPLWWPDGRPAGTAIARFELGRQVGSQTEGHRCFAIAPFSWWSIGPDRAPTRPGLRPEEVAVCALVADLLPAAKAPQRR